MRILYIDTDSLRADHLGCYGYHRNTSPVIDRIASEGMVFEQVYTSDAPCLPSRTAFFSGRFGIQSGVIGHGGTAAQPKIEGKGRGFQDYFLTKSLTAQLKQRGFRPYMISPFPERHAAHWVTAAFNQVINTGKQGMESAEEVMPFVNKWLGDNQKDDNWFLHINLWDPHTPYRVPMSYGEPFANDPIPAWLDDDALITSHREIVGTHALRKIWNNKVFPREPDGDIRDRAGMRKMIDAYDTGIRYADDAIGRIVNSLKASGVYDDTMIIISADHGESFGELGIYGEHATADESTCHVPLVIRYPGGIKGARDSALHYQLDLAPTLIELFSGQAPALWDGQSFAQTLLNGKPSGHDQLVIGQCAHVCQRSVRWNGDNGERYLYMRTYHDGFWSSLKDEMLFDLKADPHETNNLAIQRPDLRREGRARLAEWHDTQMHKMAETSSNVADPLWTVMHEGGPEHAGFSHGQESVNAFTGFVDRVRKSGLGNGADDLLKKHQKDINRALGKPGQP